MGGCASRIPGSIPGQVANEPWPPVYRPTGAIGCVLGRPERSTTSCTASIAGVDGALKRQRANRMAAGKDRQSWGVGRETECTRLLIGPPGNSGAKV